MNDKISGIRELITLGMLNEADTAISAFLINNPDSPELLTLQAEMYLKKGSLLWEKGDIDDALEYLTKALEMSPNDRDTVVKCGDVFSVLGRNDAAKNLYTSYLRINPNDKEIQQALEKLIEHGSYEDFITSHTPEQTDQKSFIKVSAIVSTYNSEHFMRGCLEDLVNQTLYQNRELEIIVIDSGSEQNEKAIVEEFQKKHKNIRYIRTGRETVYAAWNRGIKMATGKYITNANADDRHRKDALEVMANTLDQNPNTGLVYADVIKTATENETFKQHTPVGAFLWKDYSRELLTLACFIGPQPMWQKSLHDTYGYFDESFTSSGDWEFWLRIAEGTQMLHIHAFLGLYLYSPQSAEHRNPGKSTIEDQQIIHLYVPKYLSTDADIDRGLNALKLMDQKLGDSRSFEPLKYALMQLRQHISGMKQQEPPAIDIVPSREAFSQPIFPATEKPLPAEEDKPRMQKAYRQDFVSIILLVSGDPDSIRQCVRSIRKNTPEQHEIIFVPLDLSYAPPKWMRKILKENKNYRLVMPPSPNKGMSDKEQLSGNPPAISNFSVACNTAIAGAAGTYIVLLKDSVVVTDSYLSGMLEYLKKADDIGIIGPMITHAEGPQRIVIEDNNLLKDFEQYAHSFRERNRHRYALAKKLMDVCIVFTHDLFDKTGLFDNRFHFPEFSVEDYCLRASLEGYRNIIAGDVLVSYTGDTFTVVRKKELFTDKRSFISKWSAIDNQSLYSQKLPTVNALMASHEFNEKGDTNKALSILMEGLRFSPDEKKLHHALVELLVSHRKFGDALDVLQAMPDSLKHTVRWLELTGNCKEGLQAYDEADDYADHILAINVKSPVALHLKGMKAFRQGNHSDAVRFFQEAIDSDASFGEAYANLGALQWSAMNYESAFTLLERAFILSPISEDIAKNYHAASVTLSRLERASFVFREAEAFHPVNKRLKYMRADLLLQREQYHEAMDVIEEALLAFDIDDDSLALAGALREKLGPKEIKEKGSRIQGAKDPSDQQQDSRSQEAKDSSDESEKMGSTTRTLESLTPGTLSLCMIVKNEEKNIGRCLHKIEPLADEMIVVDTGSTDRTKEIAKVFGAKVYDFEWTDSFSDARNFSLSKATGAWILILDADEFIAPEDFKKLRKLIAKDPRIQGFKDSSERDSSNNFMSKAPSLSFPLVGNLSDSPLEKGETGGYSKERFRPSRNDKHLNPGTLDPSVPASIDPGILEPLNPVSFDPRILESSNPVAVAFSVVTRNYTVSMNTAGWVANDGTYFKEEVGTGWFPSKKVRLFPNDNRIRFEAPVHEFVENSLDAAGLLRKDCDIPIHHYGKLDTTKVAAKGIQYYELGKSKRDERGENDPLAIYELAVQASELGQFEKALRYWERFVELKPDFSKGFYGLGFAHFKLNQFQEAFSVVKQAVHIAQDHVEWKDAVLLLAHAAIASGRHEECIEYLDQLLEKDQDYPLGLLLLSVAYVCAGENAKGIAYIERLEELNFDATPYLAYLGQLLISEQRVSTALSILNLARELHRTTNEISALIAECEKRMRETKEKDPKILRHSESAEAERIQGVEDSKEKGPSEKDSSNNDMSIAPSPSFPLVGNLSDSPLEKGETGGYSKEGFRPLQKNGGQASRNDKKEDLDSALFKHSDPRILESSIPAFSDTGTLEPLTPGTLALCMIVKNEEDNIRRALESVKPVVDEMIVVDTGSTDRTKDIAKEMGAKVYDFVWTDSFADARNFALSKATSKWILILDADEVISPDDHDKLRELIEKDSRIQGVK